MAPILVDKDTDTKTIRWRPSEKQVRANAPWVKGYDPSDPANPDGFVFDAAQMTALKNTIRSAMGKNDAKLLAAKGDMRKAVNENGYIIVNMSAKDPHPNWQDIRRVVMANETNAQARAIPNCTRVVLRKAWEEMQAVGWFKSFDVPTREKEEATAMAVPL